MLLVPLLVQTISLTGEVDASWLRDRVRHWLDEEWIEQECHVVIAERAAASYVAARRSGLTELGDVLVKLGTDLNLIDTPSVGVGNQVCRILASDSTKLSSWLFIWPRTELSKPSKVKSISRLENTEPPFDTSSAKYFRIERS